MSINIPGEGSEQWLNFTGGAPQQIGGATYYGLTKSNWRIACVPQIKNGVGEGFVVVLPDGTRHRFDWMVQRNVTNIIDSTCMGSAYYRSLDSLQHQFNHCTTGVSVPRSEVIIYATESQDRFGNKITYEYDAAQPERLIRVFSSDGAVVNLSYGANGKISAIQSGARVWTYSYEGAGGDIRLKTITLPDGSNFSYEYGPGMYTVNWYEPLVVWRDCKLNIDTKTTSLPPGAGETNWMKITHPSGAIGTFHFRKILHGTKISENGCFFARDVYGQALQPVMSNPSAYQVASLYKKTIAGVGITQEQWEYEYRPSWNAPYTSETVVTHSSGRVQRHVFGNDSNKNYGLLLSTDLPPLIRTT